ncbi:MAG: pre-peptidase C-terminal domain-containing protein, partial [Duganella sp.]
MADDYSADINTKGRLTINGQVRGIFEASYDHDWFAVNLSANTTYLFSMTSVASANGTQLDARFATLGMYDGRGLSQVYSSSYGEAPLLQFTPTSSGTYYLSAQASYLQTAGAYRLTSSLAEADEFVADISTTANLTADTSVSGGFQRVDDVDWIRFQAQAGQVIELSTEFGGKIAPGNLMYFYDSVGRYVKFSSTGIFVADTSGEYYLVLNAEGRVGAYTQTMKLISDDYSKDASSPGVLAAGGQASGTIDYNGDTDRFQVQLEAGNFYTLRLGTQDDNYRMALSLYDSKGAYVSGQENYVNGVRTVQFFAASSGTYSIDASSPYGYSKPLPYTLSLSAPVADDFGNTRETAQLLALDETMTGSLQAVNDVDMFTLALSAGKTYRFEQPFSAGADPYATVALTDSNGNSLRNWYGQSDMFSYTPTRDGNVYLSLSSLSVPVTGRDYSVKVSAVEDDHGASAASAGRLTLGVATKGVLEAGGGDVDWYAITLNAGAYYWFSLTGAREGGGTLTPTSGSALLRIIDAQGKAVATGESGYNATAGLLAFTAPTRGTYYVEVSSPGAAGTYTVKAVLGEKDDHGNDTAHATAIQDKVALAGKLELLNDRDVFKLSAVAGMAYALEVTPVGGNANFTSYASLNISTNTGSFSTREVFGTGKILKYFTAANSGDYYFTMSTSSFGTTGAYQIAVTSQGLDDYSATNQTTGRLVPGASVPGQLGTPGDRDWIKVKLEAGRTYVFDLQGSVSGGGTLDTTANNRPSLSLLTADGSNLTSTAFSNGSAAEPRLAHIATKTGEYFLEVYSPQDRTGTYTLVASQTSGDVSAPQLLSSTQEPDAVNVGTRPKIVLTFNEIMMTEAGITFTDSNGVAVAGQDGQQLVKAIGKMLVFDPNMNLQPGMRYTLSLPEGSALDLAGNAWVGAHQYSFTVTEPVAVGTAGNDYLLGSTASGVAGQILDGGAGLDTVYYGAPRYNWQITRNSDGTVS